MLLWESYCGGEQSLGIVGEHAVLALTALGEEVLVRPWNLSPILCRSLFESKAEAANAGYPWGRRDLQARSSPELWDLVVAGRRGLSASEEVSSVGVVWGWPTAIQNTQWRLPKFHVAYMYWDLSCLPVGDAMTINRCADVVFVPSQFTRSNLLSGGVQVPVHVWPHGVKAPAGSQGGLRPRVDGVFRFLFVGVAQERKGIEELLLAWKRAFAGRDDVRLTIKSADWGKVDKYRAECDDDRIEWLHLNMPRGDLRDLYARSDCLVLPSRAESFGLPILEAMVLGLPVIVSAYGGHLDYCSDDTAYLVPGSMKPAMSTLDAVMNGYEELPQWSVCDVDLLVDTLRHVVTKPAEVERKAQRARSVADTMTWEAGAERAVPILRALQRATAADRWW